MTSPSGSSAAPATPPDPTGTGPTGTDAMAADGAAPIAHMERVPVNRFHLRVAGILGVGTFFDSFDGLVVAVALTAILTTLGASPAVAGLLVASSYAGQIIGAVGFGFLSERWGRRTTFIVSSAIFGALSLVAALAWNVESLMVVRVLQGIGLGAEVPVAAAMFNEFVRARARGRIVLIYESLFVWGILGASLMGALLLAQDKPRKVWSAFACAEHLDAAVCRSARGARAWCASPVASSRSPSDQWA